MRAAQRVDRLALLVHDVVVLEEVLARLEVAAFDLLLRALDGRVTMPCSIGTPSSMPRRCIRPEMRSRAEDAHQIVFEREIEARGAGIALAAGAAAELVVDAARLVALRADDVQTAEADHFS